MTSTITERAGLARHAKNLTSGRSDQSTALDVVAASGLAGDAIFVQIQAAAGESGARLMREMLAKIRRRITHTRWPAKTMSEQILRELVLCKCPACQGRGYIPASADGDEETRRQIDCHVCLGSGRPPVDRIARAVACGSRAYGSAEESAYRQILDWAVAREARSLARIWRIMR